MSDAGRMIEGVEQTPTHGTCITEAHFEAPPRPAQTAEVVALRLSATIHTDLRRQKTDARQIGVHLA